MQPQIIIPYGTFDQPAPQIIRFTVTDLEPGLEDIQQYINGLHRMMEQTSGPILFVVDGTLGKWLSSAARIEMGKGMRQFEDQYFDRLRRSYIVVPNTMLKMMLKGVNLVTKPKIPQTIFSKPEDALNAARNEIATWDQQPQRRSA